MFFIAILWFTASSKGLKQRPCLLLFCECSFFFIIVFLHCYMVLDWKVFFECSVDWITLQKTPLLLTNVYRIYNCYTSHFVICYLSISIQRGGNDWNAYQYPQNRMDVIFCSKLFLKPCMVYISSRNYCFFSSTNVKFYLRLNCVCYRHCYRK